MTSSISFLRKNIHVSSSYYNTLYKQWQKTIVIFVIFALSLQSCSINSTSEYCMQGNSSQETNAAKYQINEAFSNTELANVNHRTTISNVKNIQNQPREEAQKGCSSACKYALFLICGVVLGFMVGFIPTFIVAKEAVIADGILYKACTDSNSSLSKDLSTCKDTLTDCRNVLVDCQSDATTCSELKTDFCSRVHRTTCHSQFTDVHDAYTSDC